MATVHFDENEDRIPVGRREVDEQTIQEVLNELRPSDEVWLVATHENSDHLQTLIDFTLADKTTTTTVNRVLDDVDHDQFRNELRSFIERNWPTHDVGDDAHAPTQ